MSTSTPPRQPRRARGGGLALTAALVLAGLLAPAPPAGAVSATYTATGRVSVTSSGGERAQGLGDVVATSRDGRFVAFTSDAALAAGDTDGADDAYLRDRLGGVTRRVSLTDADTDAPGPAAVCALSRNGRYVAFVAGGGGWPVPGGQQLYLRDRWSLTTTLVSVDSDEQPAFLAPGDSGVYGGDECAVSDDGRYVAFQSEDGDLAAASSHDGDVYRRDLSTGTTQLVNAAMGLAEPNGSSYDVSMSGDGSVVAFTSEAGNLVASDTNAQADVFVRSFATNGTYRMSVKQGGLQIQAWSFDPSITQDGNRVVFTSSDGGLVAGDDNGEYDVFVRNRQADTVVRASLGATGAQLARGGSDGRISDDGRFVTFDHYSGDGVLPGDANLEDDVLRRDLQAAGTEYVSVTHAEVAGDAQSYEHAISGDGTVVAFQSDATDLVRNDDDESKDVFVRDFAVYTTPFANRTAFVQRQYVDFVGRAPTTAEKATWEARFAHGEAVPEQLIDELAHSTTWAGKRGPVIRLYWAFFERVPDEAGLDYWIGEATKGLSLPKMASKFAQSKEFKTQYGPLSNSAFVTAVYQNVFGRDPEPAGLAYWKGQLDSGARTRGDVMVGFSESAEGRLLLAPATDSVLVWLGMMATVPPASWSIGGVIEGYETGEPPEIIPQAILESPAYASRVGA